MKKVMPVVIIGCCVLVAALIGVGVYIVGQYNEIIQLDLKADQTQADVEVVLQRRFDLIPNLVESVKGIMDQEQEVFTAIAEARTRYSVATSGSEEKVAAANGLESSLSRLLVIIENYPELKSNQNVTALMDELAGTENRISVERQKFNEAVTSYNLKIKTFPINLFASTLGFNEKTLFAAAEGAEVAPTVDFSD